MPKTTNGRPSSVVKTAGRFRTAGPTHHRTAQRKPFFRTRHSSFNQRGRRQQNSLEGEVIHSRSGIRVRLYRPPGCQGPPRVASSNARCNVAPLNKATSPEITMLQRLLPCQIEGDRDAEMARAASLTVPSPLRQGRLKRWKVVGGGGEEGYKSASMFPRLPGRCFVDQPVLLPVNSTTR